MTDSMKRAEATIPPGLSHYGLSYLGSDLKRLASYRTQLQFTIQDNPKTCLLVGRGDGLVDGVLERAGVKTTTLDVVEELSPDVLGSVDAIPLEDDSFDVCVCCQVLEHIPYERFAVALRELRRVSRGRLVLSLPDKRRFASLRLRAPKIHVDLQWSPPRFRPLKMPPDRIEGSGHYWEIGYQGWEIAVIRRAITDSGWRIARTYRVPELSWHTFFDCRDGS